MARGDVNVAHEKVTVRRRAAAAIHSARRATTAKKDLEETAILATERAGQLIPESRLERTTTLKQSAILTHVDRASAKRASFKLDLNDARLTPYTQANFSRTGRSLLVCSERGHVAVTEWRNASMRCELYLNQTIRDATFLHSDAFFAVAQKSYAHIYDAVGGAQLHVLRNHKDPGKLTFLPHHLLLASTSAPSTPIRRLVYTDTTTGHEVASHDFAARALDLSSVRDLTHNIANGVVHAAHANGVVTLWSPTDSAPLARLFAQRGGVRHLAVSAPHKMATIGHDGETKIWDLRTFRTLHTAHTLPLSTSLAYSQRSLLAVSGASSVQIYRPEDFVAKRPHAYMTERHHGRRPTSLNFCPFEDVLAVCHTTGMCNMLVPGAGEPNFDSRAPNPYLTRKQSSELEVRTMLDKLPPETIALDPSFIGNVDKNPEARERELARVIDEAKSKKREKKLGVKKAKGKNKISKRLKRKEHHNRENSSLQRQDKMQRLRGVTQLADQIEKDRLQKENKLKDAVVTQKQDLPNALNRFLPKAARKSHDD